MVGAVWWSWENPYNCYGLLICSYCSLRQLMWMWWGILCNGLPCGLEALFLLLHQTSIMYYYPCLLQFSSFVKVLLLYLSTPHYRLMLPILEQNLITLEVFKFFVGCSAYYGIQQMVPLTLSYLIIMQACHTKAEYEEYGSSICRLNPVFKGMYWCLIYWV